MKRLLSALAKQHALFAECDQKHRRAQFIEQSFRNQHQIFVRKRIRIASRNGGIRQICQFERLLAVGRDERETGQIQVMHRLGIETEPDAPRAAKRFDFVEQRLGHNAFAVIADDDGGGARKFCLQTANQASGQFCVQAVARFAVNAHDLLFVGHDAGFDACVPRGIRDQSGAANFLSNQKLFQPMRGIVVADCAEYFRRHVQGGEVARDVGGATRHEAFTLEIHDRHRRFRRNARDAAPDELVEHHIADDEDAGFRRGIQDLPRTRDG